MKKYTFSFVGRQSTAIGIQYAITDTYQANSLGEALYMLRTDYSYIKGLSTKEDGKNIDFESVSKTELVKVDFKRIFEVMGYTHAFNDTYIKNEEPVKMTPEVEKLISKAHYNLTVKAGKPEYAPTMAEIEKEVEKLSKTI
jgi:hypothetical protein